MLGHWLAAQRRGISYGGLVAAHQHQNDHAAQPPRALATPMPISMASARAMP